ncbi:MAG TPA: hypothetical protein VMU34_09195, partial [Mycobacterium sp.]|nr:hypothetical protein [Mycobacterium sp.]
MDHRALAAGRRGRGPYRPGALRPGQTPEAADPKPAAPRAPNPSPLHPTNSAILRAFHRVDLSELAQIMTSRFGIFLVAWLLTMTGVHTFF